MTDGDEEWDLGGGSYRKLAKPAPDMELVKLTPKEAGKITAEALEAKKHQGVSSDAAEYWHHTVEPRIIDAAQDGDDRVYILGITEEMASRLIVYGKSIGWKVVPPGRNRNAIMVSWEPSIIRRAVLEAVVYFLAITVVIITAILFK